MLQCLLSMFSCRLAIKQFCEVQAERYLVVADVDVENVICRFWMQFLSMYLQ